MKGDSVCAFAAVVDVEMVRFEKGEDLGLDFHNQIDAWTKMEFNFRQQIKALRTPSAPNKALKHAKKDLKTLVYAVRERID